MLTDGPVIEEVEEKVGEQEYAEMKQEIEGRMRAAKQEALSKFKSAENTLIDETNRDALEFMKEHKKALKEYKKRKSAEHDNKVDALKAEYAKKEETAKQPFKVELAAFKKRR